MMFVFHLIVYVYFIVDSANSILHAMNNMKNQEQQGKWHPPRHLQQHTQIQVILYVPKYYGG